MVLWRQRDKFTGSYSSDDGILYPIAAWEEVGRKRVKRWRRRANKCRNAYGGDAWRWRTAEGTSRLHHPRKGRRH
jgi:hypothetical protein